MSTRRLWLAAIAVLACALVAPQLASAGHAGQRPRQNACGPDDPPIGAPIDTLVTDGAITIAGKAYGSSTDDQKLAYVVLDRTTRKDVESGSVPPDDSGITTLKKLVDTYGDRDHFPGYLMIISGRKAPPRELSGRFFPLLKELGAAVLTPRQQQRLDARLPFSVIGIPGAASGAATLRIPGRLDPPLSGAIAGYLQRNVATKLAGCQVYDYVSPEYPAFDTRTESTNTTNVMTVGDNRYAADLKDISGATAGVHILILDSLTLKPLVNHALVTNSNNPNYTDAQLQAGALGHLDRWLDDPSGKGGTAQPDITVFVQTIGKPRAAGGDWNDIADDFAQLGGNRLYANALNGTTEYALVARRGSDLPPAEASTAYDHGSYKAPNLPPARLQGVLGRTRDSTFEPLVEGAPTSVSPTAGAYVSLIKAAYRPLAPWPKLAPEEPDRARAAAAENYICKQLGFCQKDNSCPDLRSCYWQKDTSDWSGKHTNLVAISYPASQSCDARPAPDDCFSEKTFGVVKTELLTEISDVAAVKRYIEDLDKPFDRTLTEDVYNLSKISDAVQRATQTALPGDATASTLELISKVISLGKLAGGEAAAGAGAVSAVFGLAAHLSQADGQPPIGADITAAASQLGQQLFDRVKFAREELAQLRKLLVSDYGKLIEANAHIDKDWSLPDPQLTANELSVAARQWFYEALVPLGYPYLIRAYADNARSLDCTDIHKTRWPNQPDQAQMQATVGYYPDGTPAKAIFFFTRGILGASSPPGDLADKMFAPPVAKPGEPTGLGIEKLSFFTPRIFGRGIVHAADGTNNCSLGWLPAFQ